MKNEILGFGRACTVGSVVEATGTNPTLLTIASRDPGTALKALFSAARGAKL
jgi:hypothetical protein